MIFLTLWSSSFRKHFPNAEQSCVYACYKASLVHPLLTFAPFTKISPSASCLLLSMFWLFRKTGHSIFQKFNHEEVVRIHRVWKSLKSLILQQSERSELRLLSVMLCNTQQCSAMLRYAQQCSVMLSNVKICSAILSNTQQYSAKLSNTQQNINMKMGQLLIFKHCVSSFLWKKGKKHIKNILITNSYHAFSLHRARARVE